MFTPGQSLSYHSPVSQAGKQSDFRGVTALGTRQTGFSSSPLSFPPLPRTKDRSTTRRTTHGSRQRITPLALERKDQRDFAGHACELGCVPLLLRETRGAILGQPCGSAATGIVTVSVMSTAWDDSAGFSRLVPCDVRRKASKMSWDGVSRPGFCVE